MTEEWVSRSLMSKEDGVVFASKGIGCEFDQLELWECEMNMYWSYQYVL